MGPGTPAPVGPLRVFIWESWGSECLEITPHSSFIAQARKLRPKQGGIYPKLCGEHKAELWFV